MSAPANNVAAQAPLHRPFSWLRPSLKGDTHAEFLALTKSVAGGVATCLQLVQKSGMERDGGMAPMLSEGDMESLLLLATVSLQLLEKSAAEGIDFMNDCAMKEAGHA